MERKGLILGVVFSVASILAFSNLAQADAQQTVTLDQTDIVIEHGFIVNYTWPAKAGDTNTETFDVTLVINGANHPDPITVHEDPSDNGLFYSPLWEPSVSGTGTHIFTAAVGNTIKITNNTIESNLYTIDGMDESFPSSWKQKKITLSPFAATSNPATDCVSYSAYDIIPGICGMHVGVSASPACFRSKL